MWLKVVSPLQFPKNWKIYKKLNFLVWNLLEIQHFLHAVLLYHMPSVTCQIFLDHTQEQVVWQCLFYFISSKTWILKLFDSIQNFFTHAGINLTGYHPLPGHPGAFASKYVPSPRAFAQQKMPRGRASKWRCPWGRAFTSTWRLLTQLSRLKN